MKFTSTRDRTIRKSISDAIRCGLSVEGGLFVPTSLPKINWYEFSSGITYPEFTAQLLQPYFEGDALEKSLSRLCKKAFNFPIMLRTINDNTAMLELFHGSTLSFKDFGARFLAECFSELSVTQACTILVATSGDTGSAVASAFQNKINVNVVILFPKGQISFRQEHQIACWTGSNILTLAVDGTFDDCQYFVKKAFQDPLLRQKLNLCSANSINIGRLLPQISYYAYSSVKFYQQYQCQAGYIVPTGNLGNAVAGYYAKAMGFPIREIVLSTNANQVIGDYVETGKFHPHPSIQTLANAMDVGNPSNFERLCYLFPQFSDFKAHVHAYSATDKDIKGVICQVYEDYKVIICPHTATGFFARQQLSDEPWIIVATADPCKFETIIEPLLNTKTSIAPQLQAMLAKPKQTFKTIKSLEAFYNLLTAL